MNLAHFGCLFVCTFLLANAEEKIKRESDEEFFTRLFINSGYKKEDPPPLINNSFVTNVSMIIRNIKMLSEEQELITVDFSLTQSWNDARLKFDKKENNRSGIYFGSPSGKMPKKLLWTPQTDHHWKNTSIRYERVWISSTGAIEYYTLFNKVNVNCNADFTFFPVDQRNCSFAVYLESYELLREYKTLVNYRWAVGENKKKGVQSFNRIKLPGRYLNGFNLRNESYRSEHSFLPYLVVDVLISRQFFFFFTRYYVPSFFVVLISFLPLYLAPNAHSKVGLGVTVMLTMVTLVTGSYEHLPKVNYLTAMDVYLFFCFFSVFLAVFEYALIGYFELKLETIKVKKAKLEDEDCEKGDDKDKKAHLEKRHKTALKWTFGVDYVSRKLYPCFFALFHLIYLGVLAYNAHQNWKVQIRHPQT